MLKAKQNARKIKDCPRFISDEAKEHFEEHLKNKKLLLEKGFHIQASPSFGLPSYVLEAIVQRGWHKFVQNPDPLLIAVMKELYANWLDPKEEVVTVRGIEVDCSVGAINQIYGLLDIEDEYSKFIEIVTEEQINEALQLTTKEDNGIKYLTIRDPPPTTPQATESSHSGDFSSIFERVDKQNTQHALLCGRLHKFWEYSHQRDQAIKRALQRNFTKPIPQFPDFPKDILGPWTAAANPDNMPSKEQSDN
ncbi:DEAD-box ATP-dependent RNA helicase 56-like isoform X2 [Melia azedarach]|uniref:DEAD-box ATP-dependent RNA helicase 56-like isoform X2 n=1 Tax=Melia azedarach TaxID=155640 RepID=A0ACC1WV33_MELAZ|nr:DEAD-box ATP-dependent RNA helicase 56-like isoform X2 [Melia azedarach]